MENNNKRLKLYEHFIWTITNFSNLKNSEVLYSDNFVLDHHTWRVLIFPKGDDVNYLSIYLDAGGDCSNLPNGGEKFADFFIALKNQVNDKMTIRKGSEYIYRFSAEEINWGWPKFIPLDEFYDSGGGFIVNDTCVIEVEILVSESEHKNQVMKPISNIDKSFDELVEFRGLGKLEKDFVPLLEEVCSQYPSLVDSQHRRSHRFTEWAFTALGRVLHFLKTKKVKDMDNEGCDHLQMLWEELEIFRFDLTWLESHVQSALAAKIYTEKAAQVRKMKDNVAALEIQTARFKVEAESLLAKMIETNTELEIARRDLVNAEDDFEERNLDDELGYGII